MLFGKSSYKTCLVLGHILDSNGKKMSKSLGNVVDPWEVFGKQGADALRWALYTATSPGNTRRFSEDQVDEAVRKYLLTLWNTYSFFVTYARIDGFDPNRDFVEPEDRTLMDRWALSELHLTGRAAPERLGAPKRGLRSAGAPDPHGPLGPLRAPAHREGRPRAARRLRRDGGGKGHRGVRWRALGLGREAQ